MAKVDNEGKRKHYLKLSRELDYNRDSGLFYWRVKKRGLVNVGSVAGSVGELGYTSVTSRIDGDVSVIKLHRLAWFIENGELPRGLIDHINGDRSDNRVCNLREVNHSQNMMNSKLMKNNTTGYRGVTLVKKTGKYQARITINGKLISLGHFNTAKEASDEYEKQSTLHFAEYKQRRK